jgi:hypothetical protein
MRLNPASPCMGCALTRAGGLCWVRVEPGKARCMLSSSESWEPQTAPTSLALTCRWRSRPQHQFRTHALHQERCYSITSSARASTVSGTVMLSALAVFRLTISWYRVGCSTGRSPGLAPFRMRSM